MLNVNNHQRSNVYLLQHRFFHGIYFLIIVTLLSCGPVSRIVISDEDEIKIGNQFKSQIIADKENYPLYIDKAGYNQDVVNYIDSLGSLLARTQRDRPDLEFTFTIINNDTMVNAFAIPGGHIFIYTGLMRSAESGAEIAGVVAHEIGHITKYHGRELLAAKGLLGVVNDIIFGDTATIVSAVAGLLESMAFLQFSQKNEYEADECAVAYTIKAGINPRGMKSFLEKLNLFKEEGAKIFEPFSSHPPLKKRIEAVQNEIANTPNVPAVGERMFEPEYTTIKSLLGAN